MSKTIIAENQTVELAGNRVVGDQSVVAFDDGGFFDHNGSVNYKDVAALLEAKPELAVNSSEPYKPSKGVGVQSHDGKAVTEQATQWKEKLKLDYWEDYLPFADFDRIISNIGLTYKNQLAVMMWKPTNGGSNKGAHYSFAQYRTADGWMSVKGTDGKTVESMAPHSNAPVYCTFGVGDFLLLKSTGLNYLCFGGDGAAKNSPHIEFIKNKVAGKTVRLIADNDPSGKKTIGYLQSMGLEVEVFDWDQLQEVKQKMDLRDIAWMVDSVGGGLSDFTNFIKEAYYVK